MVHLYKLTASSFSLRLASVTTLAKAHEIRVRELQLREQMPRLDVIDLLGRHTVATFRFALLTPWRLFDLSLA